GSAPSRPPAGPSARALFEQATALEHASPERALGLYARVARLPGPWAAPALFAQGRLEMELGREAHGRAHLRRYLARHPDGLNTEDARRILSRGP
ncbi:MAG: hypothetical protein K8H88_13725, partial [Sandaracinaceae bacterium]|nr:hypothetical protein [Sandaracinaceae bacterium]